jgi:hypothetical protein
MVRVSTVQVSQPNSYAAASNQQVLRRRVVDVTYVESSRSIIEKTIVRGPEPVKVIQLQFSRCDIQRRRILKSVVACQSRIRAVHLSRLMITEVQPTART